MVWVMVSFEQLLTASLQVLGEQALIKPIKSKFLDILTMEDWKLRIEIMHKIPMKKIILLVPLLVSL